MTHLLPPVRDLPADRHAEIRAEVVRAMDRPPRRPWFVPTLAAAAAAVVAFAVVVLLPSDRPDTLSPAARGERLLELPPGVTAEERSEFERRCEKVDPAGGDYRLYNAITDDVGTATLLIGGPDASDCMFRSDKWVNHLNLTMRAVGGRVWLPGSIVMDSYWIRSEEHSDTPASRLVFGRVSSEVVSVRMTTDTGTIDAVVANGTFMARVIYQGPPPPDDAPVKVSAYDAEGNLLDTDDQTFAPNHDCYSLPDGRFMSGDGFIAAPPTDPAYFDERNCRPATPWR
ncbi:hypothetical protein [Actinophytocola xanthii]|uniref:Uncharacterized protein n=1 Tax=Actinophytocola xanthii TaxID=1912961 RepID=A0A1Q8BXQ7_9PSEU|nr:hypothetical protein [Actinophytocola xanthii]OLF06890.1 hypothetical protein BU204_36150 [Actinophytocola xanthii]